MPEAYPRQSSAVATADIDGDGKAEIAIAYEFAMNDPSRGKALTGHPGEGHRRPLDPHARRRTSGAFTGSAGTIKCARLSDRFGSRRWPAAPGPAGGPRMKSGYPRLLPVAPLFGPLGQASDFRTGNRRQPGPPSLLVRALNPRYLPRQTIRPQTGSAVRQQSHFFHEKFSPARGRGRSRTLRSFTPIDVGRRGTV